MNNEFKNAFDGVHAKEELKKATALRVMRKADKRKKARNLFWPRMAAACALTCLFAGVVLVRALILPSSYISIDINPSMELILNGFNRVIDVECYNEEAESIVGDMKLTGKNYKEAVNMLLESGKLASYVESGGLLCFTVASDEYDKIAENLSSLPCYKKYVALTVGCDKETAAAARENNLSCGKYRMYLLIREYDSSVTNDDCQKMNMKEMFALYEKLSGNDAKKGKPEGQGGKKQYRKGK